jgi:hypothetical protein
MWFLFTLFSIANALEVQGFLTSDCQHKVGVTVHVSDKDLEFINLQGRHENLDVDSIETLYIFNVIDNPIEKIHVDKNLQKSLRAVYTEDSKEPRALAFAVRFIEDLIVYYSLDGRSHVYTFADIYKLRPAPASSLGEHKPAFYKPSTFEFANHAKCGGVSGTVKATRVLADKISVSEFLHALDTGYESLESFEERTYLYAKPFLYDKSTRLGLIFMGKREEPSLNLPLYFQWSGGEAYRFQSFNAIGAKPHEFIPNAEPVFSLRSDVKSHFFHGLFIGNVAGLAAGNKIFSNDFMRPSTELTVQPSFNYLAMMGGDFGPYSLSVGFYFPSFGIKVRDEYREVLGSSASYAVRGMYTKSNYRLRAIAAPTSYQSSRALKADVLARTGEGGPDFAPDTFKFDAVFVRGGIDYEISEKLEFGADLISVTGNYRETVGAQANDVRFNRLTIQPYVQQNFSHYTTLTAYVNFIQNSFESNFLNRDQDREQRETRFFGTFEFIF